MAGWQPHARQSVPRPGPAATPVIITGSVHDTERSSETSTRRTLSSVSSAGSRCKCARVADTQPSPAVDAEGSDAAAAATAACVGITSRPSGPGTGAR